MNLWTQFKALWPDEPLLIGTVSSVDETRGASVITMPDGGVLIARGTSVPVGSKAFVRAGLIEGAAPELEQGELAV